MFDINNEPPMENCTSRFTSRRILFVIFNQFELLDLSGPSAVFNAAQALLKCSSYETHTLSSQGGLVRSRSNIEVNSQAFDSIKIKESDTILIVGGSCKAINEACDDTRLQKWLLTYYKQVERVGSICSGALVLATFGLLNERRATTHWSDVAQMTENFPAIQVEPDALYCVDQNIWTSAGVTTGIDMALAIVSHDHHSKVMHEVARWLVVYAHRPGYQSQFSELLSAQNSHTFSDTILWLENNLGNSVKVTDMASQASMTERTFYRKFTDEVGTSPSKFLENRRMHRAKQLLEGGTVVKAVHQRVGYQSELGFRNAFQAKYGVSPAMYKRMHCKS